MNRNLVTLIVVLCICAFSVSAFQFDALVTPESSSIKKGEIAEFNVTIWQDSASEQTFSIYSPDVQWDVPSANIDIPAQSRRTTTLRVKPYIDSLNPGYYLINIHIRPNSQDSVVRKSVLVSLRSDSQTGYLPSLRVKATAPASIDPREPSKLTVDITNLNRLDIDNAIIKVRSSQVNVDATAKIDGLGSTSVDIPIKLNANALHQDDQLTVTAFVTLNNKTYQFDAQPVTYNIGEYGEISASVATSSNWLASTKTITLTNTGNAPKTESYSERKPFFISWFQHTSPASTVTKDSEGKWFTWTIELPVSGSTTVSVTTNYTPLAVIAAIILLSIALYYLLRSPILVKKSAVVVGTREGGLTEIKILIEIKNRSAASIKNVRLLDKIPRIVQLLEEHGAGTLRPAKVLRNDQSGTLLSWNINELDAHEERVVSYRIRTKLSIVGRLHLPISVVKFERSPGRTRSTKSNISQIGFGQ